MFDLKFCCENFDGDIFIMAKRAFISVSDKEGILDFAKELIAKDYEIVSTKGTYSYFKENGVNAIFIEDFVDLSEMLSGKVKSLHPTIFAGILADITSSLEADEVQKMGIKTFDMVVVNFYPFEEIANKTDNIDELVKNIDIGGIALIRAGAKNFKNVTVICDKSDYKIALNADETTRQELAIKAYKSTAYYDEVISSKLGEVMGLEPMKNFEFKKIRDLRYGENPHQKAGLYNSPKMVDYEVLSGKELSYNNILDISTVTAIVSEFYDVNAVAIVKHTTPCGVALGKTLNEAYLKAFDCDPISAFGGIMGFSKPVDMEIAKHVNSMFVEVLVAPAYDKEALELLESKPNLRIVKLNTPLEEYKKMINEEIRVTPFGTLIQEQNTSELDKDTFKVVTKAKPTSEQIEDAVFAWKVAKHAKSNSMVIAKNFKTLAIGQGQTSRVAATEWAMNYACDGSKDAVLASDGFLPAIDNVQVAAQGRIALIIQPGGSIKDKDVIKECDKYGISMITTSVRNFRH